jgi:ubiquinone/menaquinone biosynthesis C-methylase UbiE
MRSAEPNRQPPERQPERGATTDTEVARLRHVYGTVRTGAVVTRSSSGDDPGNRAIVRERDRCVHRLLVQHGDLPLRDGHVLEVGCGHGEVLGSLVALGAPPGQLHGVDLLPDRIDEARRRRPAIDWRVGNAERLDFPDGRFALVLAFTVFSSILDPRMARNVAREMRRLLAPGGAVLWYDLRVPNPWNPDVRPIDRAALAALFPDLAPTLRSVTVIPGVARRLGRVVPSAYRFLAGWTPLQTHWLGLLRASG